MGSTKVFWFWGRVELIFNSRKHKRDKTYKASALDYCVGHYENPEIAQIILETYEEEDIKKLTGSRDGNGDTALHIAARFGSFECIGLLLGWIENVFYFALKFDFKC